MKNSSFLAAVLLSILFFTALTWAVLNERTSAPIDEPVALEMRDFATEQPALRALMVGFTFAGGILALSALAVAGGVWNLRRKQYLLAAAWVVVPLAGSLLDLGMKAVIARPRPPVEWRDSAVHETNRSYPSGHSMGSMVGLGMVAYAGWLSSWPRSRKLAATIGLAFGVLAIGFSRIFLRAHWVTDVLGGFSIGLAWLLMCVWLVERLRERAASRERFG